MKKTMLFVLAFAMFTLTAIQAHATVITLNFENINNLTNYGGLDWDQKWNIWDSSNSSYPSSSPVNVLYSHNPSLYTKFGNEVTFLGSWIASANVGQELWWEGYNNGVKTNESVHLNGGAQQFLNVNFIGVDEVRYVTAGSTEFSIIDDFKYESGQSNPVPEPSTFFLFGAGLLGAGVLRRKIRK